MMVLWGAPAMVKVLATSWRRSWKVRLMSLRRVVRRENARVTACGLLLGRILALASIWRECLKAIVLAVLRDGLLFFGELARCD